MGNHEIWRDGEMQDWDVEKRSMRRSIDVAAKGIVNLTEQNKELKAELAKHRLTWTPTPPTVSGWYWYRMMRTPFVLFVSDVQGVLVVECPDGKRVNVERMDGEWAGPLAEPQGQQETPEQLNERLARLEREQKPPNTY
jgi:hypothetical protein